MKEAIYILFGGTSEERLVSVASAQNVASQLHNPVLWFLAPDGKIFDVSRNELLDHKEPFTKNFGPKSSALYQSINDGLSAVKAANPVFFLCLHGGEGENGSLQGLFERKKIAFTGSGSDSSHQAFEKNIAKDIAKKSGVTIAPGQQFFIGGKEALLETITSFFTKHGSCILKPIDGGSSIGVFFVRSENEIEDTAFDLSKLQKRSYLMEPIIKGRELTIGVIDDGKKSRALPASEVKVDPNRQFDYEGKYLGRGTLEITPADLTPNELKLCQEMALTMHKALHCYGYSRTDLILTDKGPVYLETNTLPGLTKASFIPQQLVAAKITFNDFLLTQLDLAKKRY